MIKIKKDLKESIRDNFGVTWNGKRDYILANRLRGTIDGRYEGKYSSLYKDVQKERKKLYDAITEDIILRTKYKKGQILDIGCGPGILTFKLANKTKSKVFGIDPAEHAISSAKKNYQLDNLKFIQGKAEDVEEIFKNEKFDLIVCTRAVSFFENPEKALELMHKLLNKKGKIYIKQMDRTKESIILSALRHMKEIHDDLKKLWLVGSISLFTLEEFENLIKGKYNYKLYKIAFDKKIWKKYKKEISEETVTESEFVIVINKNC